MGQIPSGSGPLTIPIALLSTPASVISWYCVLHGRRGAQRAFEISLRSDRFFIHLAMSEINDKGEGPQWFEKVSDEDYAKTPAPVA